MPKPFQKGDPRINRAGRKKDVPNKSTEELRRLLHEFVSANIETLQADIDLLEPKDRLAFVERLLKHILPAPITSLDQLSETDLDILLKKLKNSVK
jgi:hypothetical protein